MASLQNAAIINTSGPSIEDRARGSMLGLLVGDALGVPVEGFPPKEIAEVAQSAMGSPFLTSFIPAIQMGSVVTNGREIGYRWATEVDDSNFVATGPTDNPRLADFVRTGFFSDDGSSAIALAESLVARRDLDGPHVARSYAEAWRTPPHGASGSILDGGA